MHIFKKGIHAVERVAYDRRIIADVFGSKSVYEVVFFVYNVHGCDCSIFINVFILRLIHFWDFGILRYNHLVLLRLDKVHEDKKDETRLWYRINDVYCYRKENLKMFIQKIIFIILVVVLSLAGVGSKELYDVVTKYERYSAGQERKSITLDFGEIVYSENNVKSDVTLVLVHGFWGNKDTWNRVIAEWDDTYHIIAIDLPGHGESVSKKTLGYTITDQTERLSLFLEAKKIKQFYLLGHSMGGAIALRYAANHKNNLKALILIDSMGMQQTKSDGVMLVEKSDKNPLYDVCTEERLDTLLNYSMHKPPYIPDIIKDALLQDKCARRDLEKVIYEDMYKDVNLSDVVNSIDVPTLILWGEKDRMTHVDDAALLHRTIKGSHLVIFKETGHAPIMEDPEQIANEISKFIKQTARTL